MKKKILYIMVCCVLLLGISTPAALAAAETDSGFTVLSIAYPQGGELRFSESNRLVARYIDDKTPIPLSYYYDGQLFATAPTDNAERKIEAFMAEEITFADDISAQYEFSMMERLFYKGIIKGNSKGEALPFANITRAEATAMIIRMLGLETKDAEPAGFSDVPAEEWYADVVAVAKAYGIIQGDSATLFNPNRLVTREEFVTMAARALWTAGLQEKNERVTAEDVTAAYSLRDAETISAWALPAYAVFGSDVPTDGVETGEVGAEGEVVMAHYATPQKAATRFEAAHLLWRLIESYQIYPSQAAVAYGFDQAMPIIDGSTSTYPFTQEVFRSLFSNGYRHSAMPAAHSKSYASYERLIAGEVDMVFASVYPASDILALAKEKGVELELIPIAYDAMIFFTNADNPATGLTSTQISKIYVDNTYANWKEIGGPDALLYPYCRNNDSGSHAQMERHFLYGHEINAKIRNETTSVSMANVLTDVMNAKTTEPLGYALGYSIYYYYQNMDMFYDTKTELKLLAIDGIYPTDKSIADSSYPLSNNSYIALRKDTPKDAPARQMVKYMLSEAGQECVVNAGFGPLKAN